MRKYHGKHIEIDDKITTHLKDPKNKILCEVMAKQAGFKSVSAWLADIIENKIIPNKFYQEETTNESN